MLGATLISPLHQPARAATAPNIVLILTDDQRWDALQQMPNVQSLIADQGVTFSNSFVVNPLCCPSRATILTGDYSHSTGVYKNGNEYGGFGSFTDTSTLATWLDGAGYQTSLFGKYLNGYHVASYIPPGWDRWFASSTNNIGGFEYYNYDISDQGVNVHYGSEPSDYSTDVIASKADSWIRSADPTKPIFTYFAPASPHNPATPAPQYVNALPDLAPYRPPSYNELDVTDKPDYIQATPLLNQAAQADLDAYRLDQYRTLLSTDDAVGQLVQALTDTGRLSNTMIVFASDNGYSWGEHRRDKQKTVPYDEAIRVPLIIRYDPLTSTPWTDSHLVANIDWAPTFAELAGAPTPAVEGTSLMPLIRQQQVNWRSEIGVEHLQGLGDKVPSYCSVRGLDYQYVFYQTGEQELYDMNVDPWQLTNVATDSGYASVLAQMNADARSICDPPPPNGFSFDVSPPVVTITSGPASLTTATSATFTFSANVSASFACEIDGAVLTSCTSPKTYSGLSPGDHFFSVAATNSGLIGTAAWHWTQALPVSITDSGYSPASVSPGQGVTVLWSNVGSASHTVTDASGMGLYDSGPLVPGATYSFKFTAAGSYLYTDTLNPTIQGQSKVPLLVSPTSGNVTTTFTVTWASATASPSYTYNVQIRRPGSTQWTPWVSNTTPSQTFVPDAGVGTYSFRARLKNTVNGKASAWSTTKSITVT